MQAVRHARSVLSQRAVGAAPVPLVRRDAVEKRIAAVRARAIVFARALQEPPFRHETVHRLRTHLRRLPAYEGILQRPRIAARRAGFRAGRGDPRTVAALKRLQRTLGDYCDRDQFRRLARKMNLECQSEMKKEYRRYRQRARAAVRRLAPPQSSLIALR